MDTSLFLRFMLRFLHVLILITASSSKEVIEIKPETKADIFSTNYPQSYLPREDTEWQITHEYGRWLITLQDFHIEYSPGCIKDYLEIRENNTRPKRFCGRKAKQDIISTSSNVRVYFHSDETEERGGFRLTVKRVLDEEDMKRKSQEEAANAHVYKKEEFYYDSWIFKVLLGALGCAMLVFTVLITFLCLEMRKKRLERRPKQQYLKSQSDMVHWPRIRSDSKCYGRQDSSSSTAPLTANGRY